ncbi:keratin, type I cytoskeletal 18-like isoform X1 [Takifugu flavidus]|uniref:Keratin, type I cytoskeletal 18 n=1 Tax=Takifugu flavidus TaxID=433684 RepID=A0A5C6NBZ5_9TELE|nr:keratin, type I cytoskeletal 18-like isoform X1 [Takifugu flavidus]TWW63971.1 Keratin, type I cytoskeletal 18 [Takifugu flavidus]
MPSNTAASMFGGAGGRGSRASVSSLQGLRSMLRKDERDHPAVDQAKPTASAPPAAADAPVDVKQTLRGLNDRLSGYLGKVKRLENENGDLEREIDEILAKRKTPKGRDWDEIEKPLEGLKKQVKDVTMDNATLLLQIDNAKLAEEDLKNKLDDEIKARKVLEKEVVNLKKTYEDTKLNRQQTQKEIDLVKEELERLNQDHKDEVEGLCEKIRDSEVKVEIDSHNSNLAIMLNNIRHQYDNLAKKNLKDTEDWYQNEFENIKVVEAQNNEALLSGKKDLKELLKQKQTLDIRIQSIQAMIRNLEESLLNAKCEYQQHQAPLNKMLLDLESELRKVRSQVERQVETNKNLLCVKMKLEAEINNYQLLIHGMTVDNESLDFSLEDVLLQEEHKPKNQMIVAQDEASVKQKDAPPSNSAPPGDPRAELADMLCEDAAAQHNGPPMETKKEKNDSSASSSSSSSSSSSEEEEKPAIEEA